MFGEFDIDVTQDMTRGFILMPTPPHGILFSGDGIDLFVATYDLDLERVGGFHKQGI